MIGYIFGAYFKQFSLSFPDVNKDKGVAEMAPLTTKLSYGSQDQLVRTKTNK